MFSEAPGNASVELVNNQSSLAMISRQALIHNIYRLPLRLSRARIQRMFDLWLCIVSAAPPTLVVWHERCR